MAYTYSPRTGRYEFIQPMFFASPRQKSRRKGQDPPPYPPPPTPSGGRTHPAQSPGQGSTKTSRRPPSTPGRGSNSNLEYYYPQGTPPGIVRPGAYMPPPSKKRASRLSTGTVVPPSTPQRQRRNSTVPTPGPQLRKSWQVLPVGIRASSGFAASNFCYCRSVPRRQETEKESALRPL